MSRLTDAALATAGMVLFALFSHTAFPTFALALAGLGLPALALARTLRSDEPLAEIFGVTGVSRSVLAWSIGVLVGTVALSGLFRHSVGRPLLPASLEWFLFPAASIGAAEELLFRGYIQGRLGSLGWPSAVLLAAGAHTAYKVALFAFPPGQHVIQYGALASWTFAVGAVLGLTRHGSRSVLPAVAGHVFFDILVYGDWTQAPWWVWG